MADIPNKAATYSGKLDILRDQYVDYGFDFADDIEPEQLYAGVGGAFVGRQLPSPDNLPDTSDDAKAYLAEVVQPRLAADAERGHEPALAIARTVGTIAASLTILESDWTRSLWVRSKDLVVEGRFKVSHDGINRQVLEYGMGLRGFGSHMRNVRAGRYVVHGVVLGRPEAVVLDAARDYVGIAEDQMTHAHGGLRPWVEQALDDSQSAADLVVATRTHAAGDQLRYGIEQAGKLLREGGLLVACGPCEPENPETTYDYDEVPGQIEGAPDMELVLEKRFVISENPYRPREPNRLVVARKV